MGVALTEAEECGGLRLGPCELGFYGVPLNRHEWWHRWLVVINFTSSLSSATFRQSELGRVTQPFYVSDSAPVGGDDDNSIGDLRTTRVQTRGSTYYWNFFFNKYLYCFWSVVGCVLFYVVFWASEDFGIQDGAVGQGDWGRAELKVSGNEVKKICEARIYEGLFMTMLWLSRCWQDFEDGRVLCAMCKCHLK